MTNPAPENHGFTTENILRMYLYIWNQQDIFERQLSDAKDHDSYFLWLAGAFVSQLSTAIRQGLHQEYRPRHEWIEGLRGRIDFATLSRSPERAIGRLACEFEELTPQTLENRVLASAAASLRKGLALEENDARNSSTIKARAHDLKNTLGALSQRLPAPLEVHHPLDFMGLYQRQSKRVYQKLILLSRLILKPLSLHDGDDKMLTPHAKAQGTLFENFLKKWLGYRFRESVGGSRYHWDSTPHHQYLPTLNTDIAIETDNSLCIFDAKCYARTLKVRESGDDGVGQIRLDSGNLYQLYAYLSRAQVTHPAKEVTGGLIYSHSPRSGEDEPIEQVKNPLTDISIGEFPISVHFLGMDHLPWREVEETLEAFAAYVESRSPLAAP